MNWLTVVDEKGNISYRQLPPPRNKLYINKIEYNNKIISNKNENNDLKNENKAKYTKTQLLESISNDYNSLFKLLITDKIKKYNKKQLTLLQFKLQDLNTFLTLYTKKKKVKIGHILATQV